jgi:lipid-binding SYLF domain-containing protein
VLAATGLVSVAVAAEDKDEAKKVTEATEVFHELISSTDKAIPRELLEHCKGIAVFPGVIKAAMGVGARHGRGVVSTRTEKGWTTPAFASINGGSAGFQIGVESTDLVLFFMNDRGLKSLMNGTKITLGGKASVAAGPFGRSGEAATNLELKSEIYSYARSKGLFAGLSLEGARVAPDNKSNVEYYGRGVNTKQLLMGKTPATVPAEAQEFLKALP